MGKKLFNYVIGNPPYQEEFTAEGNKTYAAPVYNQFMDAANVVGEKVELIHPARFLSNAGSTPKAWNRKMLNDPHFKVLRYEEDASTMFPNTDIKGGVAITYHDDSQDFGAINVFTKYDELNRILQKVVSNPNIEFADMTAIVITRTAYRMTDKMHEDHPEALSQLSNGHAYDMSTNIFKRLPQIFFDKVQEDGYAYARILGRENNARVYKYMRRDYLNNVINFEKFKILAPKANGNGTYGEVITQPLIEGPNTGSTESFLSIGMFETEIEATNCFKYISTKFCRALLSILKTTPDLTPEKFQYVPLQDFTTSSDIDWSKSIHEIDLQLYRKYGLDENEIGFIETHVKEMA